MHANVIDTVTVLFSVGITNTLIGVLFLLFSNAMRIGRWNAAFGFSMVTSGMILHFLQLRYTSTEEFIGVLAPLLLIEVGAVSLLIFETIQATRNGDRNG